VVVHAVAGEALLRQDGPDLAVEINSQGRDGKKKEEEGGLHQLH
jgi:hypothetical protein